MKITLFSFGFKHGCPETDMIWDVRFLPNPYWEPHLRDHTGLEEPVAAYALNNATGRDFLEHFDRLVIFTADSHRKAGREEIACAVGCTGGRHRSVAVIEHLRRLFFGCIDSGDELVVYHRDIDKE